MLQLFIFFSDIRLQIFFAFFLKLVAKSSPAGLKTNTCSFRIEGDLNTVDPPCIPLFLPKPLQDAYDVFPVKVDQIAFSKAEILIHVNDIYKCGFRLLSKSLGRRQSQLYPRIVPPNSFNLDMTRNSGTTFI